MNKSNVLFIVIDSARIDHFGLYGYDRKTTPLLDSVAEDFLIYDNANTPAAWTRPAMVSIFTSLYPEQYGFFDDKYPEDRFPLLSSVVAGRGYRVILLSNNPYMSPATGFDHGAERFYFVYQGVFPKMLDKRVVLRRLLGLARQRLRRGTAYKVAAEMLNDQARLLIRQAQSWSKPFFLYIHHDAHHPYLSDRKYLRMFLDKSFAEDEIRLAEAVQQSGNMAWFIRDSLGAEERERYYRILRSMHDASIYKNDLLVHSLLKDLKTNGLYENTMVIITADHGEFLGERNLISHGLYPYEESVHVPLLIKYPKDCGLRGRSSRLVSTVDLAPTVSELAGAEIRDYIPQAQGVSLFSDNRHEFVITQRKNFAKGMDYFRKKYPDHSFEQYDVGNLVSFKSLTRKFVWSSKGRHALFNLEADPKEIHDLYSQDDSRSRTYLNRAEAWLSNVPKVRNQGIAEFDPKIKEHLRGLGYIE